MHDHLTRFECRLEPSGTWMVWDYSTRAVAHLAGYQLQGQESHRAQAAYAVLASIYGSHLDAPSVRTSQSRLWMRKTRCFGQKQRV